MSEVLCEVKLKVPAGKATPSPAIASVLGQRGVNIMKFCQTCNALTEKSFDLSEEIIVVVIIKVDKSFDLVVKGVSASNMLKKAAKIQKGSSSPGKSFVGTIPIAEVIKIAEQKLPSMNAYDVDTAVKMIRGSAFSMGLKIEG